MNAADYQLPALRRFVPHAEFRPEWLPFLANRRSDWCLPTERVVIAFEMQYPQLARVYETGLYLPNVPPLGKPCTPDELRAPDFKGLYAHQQILLCEIYSDTGSDGHIENRLVGWCFMPESALKRYAEWDDSGEFRRREPRLAPEFMRYRYSDDMEIP
jgi:hypothetical protein